MTEARNHDQLVIHIKETLASAKPPFTTECCIYRVPSEIRNLKEDAYTPKVISIGPLHYGDKKLQNMESLKQIYCQKFIERAETSLESLVSCIQELEPKVRLCYSENIELGAEAFVKLILVDCGFIFELFTRNSTHDWEDDHGIVLKPWLITDIVFDLLLLLENQIPFFVLEEIYGLAFPSSSKDSSFLKLTFEFFDDYNRQKLEPSFSIKHFTDLLRTFHLQPHYKQPPREKKLVKHLHNATELSEAGIKFKVNKSNCLLDLHFSGRYLEIPELSVDDSTEIVFRNMVALEQCHYPDKAYITDYVVVLDFLINTGNDVEVLVQNEIIGNWIGDNNAVAELCNGLCKNITQTNFNSHYFDTCDRLNAYCKHPWHRKKATLRRDYCNTPWQTVASVAGIMLLFLTIIQTVCSILQVK